MPAGWNAARRIAVDFGPELQLRQLAIELQSGVLAVLPQARREDFLTQLAAVADACREAAEHSPKRGK